MSSLNGQVAVVTGGSRGIGSAISIALAAKGAKVYVNYTSRPDSAEATAKLCNEAGGEGVPIQFNVSDSDSVDAAFAKVKEESGKVDILVNNAGITNDGIFIRTKNEDWNRVLDVNLNGAFYCSRAAAKLMMKARTGRIVNISSVVGEMGNPGQASYVASKAGLIGLTKSLAKELAVRNITVNAITPGFIATEMTDELDEKVKAQYEAGIALGRFGAPEEVAAAAVFLCSEGAGYISGQVLGVNGGLYM